MTTKCIRQHTGYISTEYIAYVLPYQNIRPCLVMFILRITHEGRVEKTQKVTQSHEKCRIVSDLTAPPVRIDGGRMALNI